jgi:hypothetical protein
MGCRHKPDGSTISAGKDSVYMCIAPGIASPLRLAILFAEQVKCAAGRGLALHRQNTIIEKKLQQLGPPYFRWSAHRMLLLRHAMAWRLEAVGRIQYCKAICLDCTSRDMCPAICVSSRPRLFGRDRGTVHFFVSNVNRAGQLHGTRWSVDKTSRRRSGLIEV